VCNFPIHLPGLFWGYLLDKTSRDAGKNGTRFHYRPRKDDRTGGDDSALADYGMVKDNGTHTNEGTMADVGTMDSDIVAYRDFITNLNDGLLIESVQDGAILYIDAIANADGIDVATYHSSEPEATLSSNLHITDNNGIVG
jgi:hypothetical protein